MTRDCKIGNWAPLLGLLILLPALLLVLLYHRLVKEVHKVVCVECAQTHILSRLGRGGDASVLVEETGCSALYHLQAGKSCSGINNIGSKIVLHLPNLVQPALKKIILLRAPHKGHCTVAMHIYKARQRHHPLRIQHLIMLLLLPALLLIPALLLFLALPLFLALLLTRLHLSALFFPAQLFFLAVLLCGHYILD